MFGYMGGVAYHESQADLNTLKPLSLGLVAWLANSDWVINPSSVADVLMCFRFHSLFQYIH